jgi:hypothetical protein
MSYECDEAIVTRNQTFYVGCQPLRAGISDRLPAHRLVVEPIIRNATEMRIFGLPNESDLYADVMTIGVKTVGYINIDLSNEVVRGHEAIWNATAWRRGAIVLAATLKDEDLADIFQWCDGPGTWCSMAEMRKGTPAPAITRARAIAANGALGFSFSASNGLQWVDIFPPAADTMRLFRLARTSCRPFKRFVEHNPGANEIIIDCPPYRDMV